jgi:predicted GTPase
MTRSNSEQALVDFILRTINTKTSNEIIDIHDKMELTLQELLSGGLNATLLNDLPEYFIQNCVNKEGIDKDTLETAGLDSQIIGRIFGAAVNEPVEQSWDTIFKTQEPPSQVENTEETISFFGTNTMGREDLLTSIANNKALIADIQDGLNKGTIEAADMANLGFSYDFIERLQSFQAQSPIFPKLSDLPPLRTNATDIYFLGMPGSGKSTMLAALFSYCNEIGVMKNIVDNQFGNKYRNQLVLGMAQGYLPSSTPSEFINFIPVDMKYEGQDHYQQLNFLDMAGEKFKSVADEGVEEFSAYKNYLNNNNPKCLIFVIDYFENNKVEALKQDQNLQQVLSLLEAYGILEKTEAVYLVVTKADLFSSPNKQEYADNYIRTRYRNFLNACKEAKDAYNFVLKSFPYSIGPAKFSYILEDCDSSTNANLVEYPKLLLQQLEHDMAYKKDSKLSKWFGKGK